MFNIKNDFETFFKIWVKSLKDWILILKNFIIQSNVEKWKEIIIELDVSLAQINQLKNTIVNDENNEVENNEVENNEVENNEVENNEVENDEDGNKVSNKVSNEVSNKVSNENNFYTIIESIYFLLLLITHNFLDINVIDVLKKEQSYSYSDNIEKNIKQLTKQVTISENNYNTCKENIFMIINSENSKNLNSENLNSENSKNLNSENLKFENLQKKGVLATAIILYNNLYNKYQNKKYQKLTENLKNKIINIKLLKINNTKQFDPIQLICTPIMPINDNLHFQNSSIVIKYNINSLIDKTQYIETVLSGLNLKLIERLKTIIFTKQLKLSNNSKIIKASFDKKTEKCEETEETEETEKCEETEETEDGEKYNKKLQLYHNKYLFITETIILNKFKNENHTNLSLKDKFDIAIKNDEIKGIVYPTEVLIKELSKEFTISFNLFISNLISNLISNQSNQKLFTKKSKYWNINSAYKKYTIKKHGGNLPIYDATSNATTNATTNELALARLTQLNFKEILINEYNFKDNYIHKALSNIHANLMKDYILKKQILNPHINLSRFEKETKISQMLHIMSNANSIWFQIKNSITLHKEDFENITFEEQKKALLKHANRIFTTAISNIELESIPIKFKLFCL